MSSEIQSLRKAIISGHPSLTRLLRRTKWVAARLNLKDMEQWLDLELNGYGEDAEPPKYRKVFTHFLEVYNEQRGSWQFAGNVQRALQVRQPVSEIESYLSKDRVEFPVAKNFSIRNDLGDSFGSDWPQRFVVAGSQFKGVIEGVVLRWTAELEKRGLALSSVEKFTATLKDMTDQDPMQG
jgi:hypothetical protein